MEKPVFTVSVENEEDGPTGGYIPDDLPYDVPIIGDQRNVSLYQIHAFSPNRVGNGQEETYYNAYDEGKLPAIRNQGSEGACWAFASMGAVEMDLITDGNADKDTIDLSELQLAYFTAHNYDDNAEDMLTACINLAGCESARPWLLRNNIKIIYYCLYYPYHIRHSNQENYKFNSFKNNNK